MTFLQAPRWLPQRIRTRWDQIRIRSALHGLDSTRPLSAVDPEEAEAEVHMLLCRRDVMIGVLALKSLLRFEDLRLAVTLTNDGSLSDADFTWINSHVPNCRWLPRRPDDSRIHSALKNRHHLRRLYESNFDLIAKVVHPIVLSRCSRVILLDPDTAFFESPTDLIRWVQGESNAAYYLCDSVEKNSWVPASVREAFAVLASNLEQIEGPWRLDRYFFNSGLLLYRQNQCNLDIAERFIEWRNDRLNTFEPGVSQVWFGEWTPEQTAYLAMFAKMTPTAEPLSDTFVLGSDGVGVFNHFMREHLIRPSTLRKLRDFVKQLPRRT